MKNLLLPLVLLACTSAASSQQLTVAAAADLRPALEEIATSFKSSSGIALRVSYGSSGNFFQQLQNGAPFDAFLSANVDYPKKLADAGLTVSDSYYEFARGSIVLMVPYDSKLDLSEGLHILLTPTVKKIAIANPSHAPYGQAAVAAIKSTGIYDWAAPHLVNGENVSQAASFVLSGAAEVGIVAKSLALAPAAAKQVKFVDVPAKDYPPLLQAMVVLKSSKNQRDAMRLVDYMRGERAKMILKQYGFEVPENGSPFQ
jgi:molybdate transport system substrate-binding protein